MNALLRACLASLLAVATATALGACAASEGGPVGSGITSFVAGNVIDVQSESSAEADAAAALTAGAAAGAGSIASVLITIDEAGLETTTGSDGAFELAGELAGPTTLRFRDPQDRSLLGEVTVDVPPGATVFLRDVEIRRDLDVPVLHPDPLVFNFVGDVADLDCAEGVLRVRGSDGGSSVELVLRLRDEEALVDAGGATVPCSTLRPGDRVALEEGVAALDANVVDAVRLVVDPSRGPDPQRSEFPATRRGVLLRADCAGALLVLQDDRHGDLVAVRIGADTVLECGEDTAPCACDDLQLGDRVEARGVRRRGNLDVLEAAVVTVGRNADAFVIERLSGDVEEIDCAGGSLTIGGLQLAEHALAAADRVRVGLSSSTSYTCRAVAAEECGCEDVRLRDRVELRVLVPLDDPGATPEALEVFVVASRIQRIEGTVAAVSCRQDTIDIVARSGERTSLALGFSTLVRTPDGAVLACNQIEPGARVVVVARVVPARDGPDTLVADEIIVLSGPPPTPTPVPAPGEAFGASGRVGGVDCRMGRRGLLLLTAEGGQVRVRITARTDILRGREPVACSDIREGEPVTVTGAVQPHPLYDVVATRIVLSTLPPAADVPG